MRGSRVALTLSHRDNETTFKHGRTSGVDYLSAVSDGLSWYSDQGFQSGSNDTK